MLCIKPLQIVVTLLLSFQVDAIVTSGGGVEEDLMKCFSPHLLGSFDIPGDRLLHMGINRIGNLLVPNSNYNVFQKWITQILDQMLEEQRNEVSNAWLIISSTLIFFIGNNACLLPHPPKLGCSTVPITPLLVTQDTYKLPMHDQLYYLVT